MRLDKYLSQNGFAESRNRALILLEKDCVLVNGKKQKASYEVKDSDVVSIIEPIKYVSMGGYKLERALSEFKIDVLDKTCADIGCSKGGFSQCLIVNGAKKVVAVDVNLDELDFSLKQDKRITPIKLNAREICENSFEKVDFICVDCSFISIKYILPNLLTVLKDGGKLVVLLKPQFECGEKNLTKKGFVKNKTILKNICQDFVKYFNSFNLNIKGFTNAPIRENRNLEFLFYLSRQNGGLSSQNIIDIIEELK